MPPRTPASTRPTRAKGRATRARLVDAGVKVFSRRGFRATRVDDIVKKARTSHGTFYLYFSSKDDLFEQLVTEIAEEFASLTDSLPEIRPTEQSRDALQDWLVEFIELYERFGPLIRSWTEAERDGSPSEGTDVLATVAEGLASKVKVRRRKDLDPAIASLAVVAMIERVNYFKITGQLDPSSQELAHTLADIVLDAFFGPAEG